MIKLLFIGFVSMIVILVMTVLTNSQARADGVVNWTGNGWPNPTCSSSSTTMLWIFTTGGNDSVTAADLTVNGTDYGAMTQMGQGSWHLTIAYQDMTGGTARVAYTGGLGKPNSFLPQSTYHQ